MPLELASGRPLEQLTGSEWEILWEIRLAPEWATPWATASRPKNSIVQPLGHLRSWPRRIGMSPHNTQPPPWQICPAWP